MKLFGPKIERHLELPGTGMPGGVGDGFLTDAQWRRLTETSVRRLGDGRVTPHYDPAMVQQFTHHENDYLIWDHYDALDIPVLCLLAAIAAACGVPVPTARVTSIWLKSLRFRRRA